MKSHPVAGQKMIDGNAPTAQMMSLYCRLKFKKGRFLMIDDRPDTTATTAS
jgi:hypothetical protein